MNTNLEILSAEVPLAKSEFADIKSQAKLLLLNKMKKKEMLMKNQITHVRAEKDILSRANNPWIVNLKCSFQDSNNLYLVMEYLPGGDLMNLLIK